MDLQPVGAPPPAPKRVSSASLSRKSTGLRDSLLNSLQQQQQHNRPSSDTSSNLSGHFSNIKLSSSRNKDGDDETIKDSRRTSNRSSFPLIPSLRNSLKSSIHSKSKKNSITKDLNSIMEIYDLISVKDFGYPASNSLHYGLSNYELYLNNNQSNSQLDNYYNNNINLGFFSGFNSSEKPQSGYQIHDSPVEEEPVQKAIVLFDFQPENDNELELTENQIINILYRHGQGWLVGEDPETANTGLIPEEYVELIFEEDGQIFTASQLMAAAEKETDGEKAKSTDIKNEDVGEDKDPDDLDIFYNARSQLGSPTESAHSPKIDDICDPINARTTLIPGSPLSNKSNHNEDDEQESNYTLDRSDGVDNSNNSNELDYEDQDKVDFSSISYFNKSATTPNPMDKSGDFSNSDKFSNELESETSDLQIDNTELKRFLPDLFRANSSLSNSPGNTTDSPISMTNSTSYPRLHKRSLSANANPGLLFGNLTRNSSRSNSLINGKSVVSSFMSMPRSASLNRSFMGFASSNINDELDLLERFKAPNLLSKENYFMDGGGFSNGSSRSGNNTVSGSNTDEDGDFWVDEEFKDFEIKFHRDKVDLSKKDESIQVDERVEEEMKEEKKVLASSEFDTLDDDKSQSSAVSPVISVSSTHSTSIVESSVTSSIGSKLPKSLTMKSISGHTKLFVSHENDKKGFTRVLSRKFSRIRLKGSPTTATS